MKEAVYGFPCVENPNDFSPDAECCTPEEIAAHKADCEAWNNGMYQRDRKRFCHHIPGGHVTKTPWGIGVNMVDFGDEGEGLNG